MMNDFEQIESISGESGNLSQGARSMIALNDSFTRAYDQMFGPDETDSFDASCNTCKHFVRRPMITQEKSERNIFGMPGRCAIKQVDVRGWQRGQFCKFENETCYENRRTGMRPKDACRLKDVKHG